jgi:hypothetical protein
VRLVLDLDATEDPTHGQQELNFYNHHYRSHCYLPLLVYATVTVETPGGERRELPEQELLVSLLRPVNKEAAFRAVAVLRRLVPLLRQQWPGVEVLVRADSGFARPELIFEVPGRIGVSGPRSLDRSVQVARPVQWKRKRRIAGCIN